MDCNGRSVFLNARFGSAVFYCTFATETLAIFTRPTLAHKTAEEGVLLRPRPNPSAGLRTYMPALVLSGWN